jgi:hypothetical protein
MLERQSEANMRIVLASMLLLGLGACSDVGSLVPAWDDDTPDTPAVRTAEPMPAQPMPAESEAMPAEAPPAATAPASQPLSVETARLPPQAAPAAVNSHCQKIARQRATDAAYAGEDEETQEAVYNRSYADCMAWDSKHAL